MHGQSRTDNENETRVPKFRFYGEEFVLDTVSGNFYRVTPTAAFILRALSDGRDDTELAGIVERQFGIDHAKAIRDIE
jgi:Coenzyme PQQ synthesis protein D (PqqD)